MATQATSAPTLTSAADDLAAERLGEAQRVAFRRPAGCIGCAGVRLRAARVPSSGEQVDALPFVEEVRTETSRVPGAGSVRRQESWVTLSAQDLTTDPAGVAEGLAGVTWGYRQSHWSIDELPSTAEVRDLGPVAEEPVRWWAEAVAALGQIDPQAALDCRITHAALSCDVDAGDPGRALEALATVDGTDIAPWLSGARADDGEATGFSLTVGGRTFTDATSIG